MYMRIVWGRLRPGQWDQYEEAYKRVLGSNRNIAGLEGRWLVRDVADPDAGYSVSLWASEEAMRAYERSDLFRKKVKPALQPFFVDDFTTAHCEVGSWRNSAAEAAWFPPRRHRGLPAERMQHDDRP